MLQQFLVNVASSVKESVSKTILSSPPERSGPTPSLPILRVDLRHLNLSPGKITQRVSVVCVPHSPRTDSCNTR
jgi:hypothetical protein